MSGKHAPGRASMTELLSAKSHFLSRERPLLRERSGFPVECDITLHYVLLRRDAEPFSPRRNIIAGLINCSFILTGLHLGRISSSVSPFADGPKKRPMGGPDGVGPSHGSTA